MCVTCGCGETEHKHSHDEHHHENNHVHTHLATVNLETEILAENTMFAKRNTDYFNHNNILAINLLSSPGSGKTTILEQAICYLTPDLSDDGNIYVIEGDQHTELDSNRVRNVGAIAYQINTGKACHLDGHMISHALEHLDIKRNSYLFIENVGNLICPALFDLGEHFKIVIISVTEGEDKPLKYPDMFYEADLVIINKIDLLPYVKFNINNCKDNIHKINKNVEVLELSATTQDGFTELINWIKLKRTSADAKCL